MARYIDAERLKLSIIELREDAIRNKMESQTWAFNACEYMVDFAPTVDVEEVRHGEWLEGYKWQPCSECYKRGKRSWKYCPNCGAKMDGKEQADGET